MNYEFYNTPDGRIVVKSDAEQEAHALTQADRECIAELIETIRRSYPYAYKELCKIYEKSKPNRRYYEFLIVRRFIRCNFGEYDLSRTDFNNGCCNFEEVKCPLRGECQHEGIVCKPVFHTHLSEREMQVLRMIVDHFQTDRIANELGISPNTVNNHRENIKQKLNCQSISELVEFWYKNNLL